MVNSISGSAPELVRNRTLSRRFTYFVFVTRQTHELSAFVGELIEGKLNRLSADMSNKRNLAVVHIIRGSRNPDGRVIASAGSGTKIIPPPV
jgi:hypothetical protein